MSDNRYVTINNKVANAGNAIYGLGVFGAWVWFWQQDHGFWPHVWDIVQGVFWPAWMTYYLFAALT